jgi:hypothetical protein
MGNRAEELLDHQLEVLVPRCRNEVLRGGGVPPQWYTSFYKYFLNEMND